MGCLGWSDPAAHPCTAAQTLDSVVEAITVVTMQAWGVFLLCMLIAVWGAGAAMSHPGWRRGICLHCTVPITCQPPTLRLGDIVHKCALEAWHQLRNPWPEAQTLRQSRPMCRGPQRHARSGFGWCHLHREGRLCSLELLSPDRAALLADPSVTAQQLVVYRAGHHK